MIINAHALGPIKAAPRVLGLAVISPIPLPSPNIYMGIMKLQLIRKHRPFSFLPALTGAPGPFQHSDRQEIER